MEPIEKPEWPESVEVFTPRIVEQAREFLQSMIEHDELQVKAQSWNFDRTLGIVVMRDEWLVHETYFGLIGRQRLFAGRTGPVLSVNALIELAAEINEGYAARPELDDA